MSFHSIEDQLVAYYRMDETSVSPFTSTRKEALHRPAELTVAGTVASVAGKSGLAASFSGGTGDRLLSSDIHAFGTGNLSFTIAAWVSIHDDVTTMPLIHVNNTSWRLFYDGSAQRFAFRVKKPDTSETTVLANNFGLPSTDTYYHIVAWHDATADTINIAVDDGTADSASVSTGVEVNATGIFRVGARTDISEGTDADIDEVGYWRKALSASDRTTLYNSGTGRALPILKFPVDTNLGLGNGLVAHWKLEEDAGKKRTDMIGRNDLSDQNNNVSRVTGKVNNGGQFTDGGSTYLVITSNNYFRIGNGSVSIGMWVNLDSKPSGETAIIEKGTGPGGIEYRLIYDGTADRFIFNVPGLTPDTITANNLGSPSTGTWYYIVASYDTETGTLSIQVNNGTVNSTSVTGTVDGTNTSSFLGIGGAIADTSKDLPAKVDEVSIWRRGLTTQERTDLYNSGTGQSPHRGFQFDIDTDRALSSALSAYWKLDEASGTDRNDFVLSGDLDDNNTVGQSTGVVGQSADFPNTSDPTGNPAVDAHFTLKDLANYLDVSFGDVDFTIAGWVRVDTPGKTQRIVAKRNGSFGGEYFLEYNASSNKLRFRITNQGTGDADVSSTNTFPTGAFHFVVLEHDATANTIKIAIDNAAAASGGTSAIYPRPLGPSNTFSIGGDYFDNEFLLGRVDELGFWKRLLTAQEKTDLYNGGSGTTTEAIVDSFTQTINSDTSIQATTEQTINSDTTVLTGQSLNTINSDSEIINAQPVQTINSDTSISGTTEQTINSDTTVLTSQSQETITSDTEINGVVVTQTITSDTAVAVTQSQTIQSDTSVKQTGVTQVIGSDTDVTVQSLQTIQSNTDILVREVDLKLFIESDLSTEIGTVTDPLDFGSIEAGISTTHPDNPFVLYNDKGGLLLSVDAREVTISVVRMELVDELVGTGDGTASQTFTVAFPPVLDTDDIVVKVNNIPWTRVTSFVGQDATSEVYTIDPTTGVVTFGNGTQGDVPGIGESIKVTYEPDTLLFGKQLEEQLWIGVQSNGVISTNIAELLEERTPIDTTHVQVIHAPQVVSVSGVWLLSDPNRLGTNYFTGGGFNASSGLVTLGTALPDTGDVYIDYVYTIEDDLEGSFSQIGQTVKHTFANVIPRNNAKRLYFRVSVPSNASPSGLDTIRFKVRLEYTQ